MPTLPPGVLIHAPANVEFVLRNEAAITKGDFFKSRSWDLFGKMGNSRELQHVSHSM